MKETPPVWEIVNNINEKTGGVLDEEFIKTHYNEWIVNTSMSNNIDTLALAEVMNRCQRLDVYTQYLFYYYGVKKFRRYGKWQKKDSSNDNKLSLIKDYYGYSTIKAKEILPVIDKLDVWDDIKKDLDRGGVVKR